MPFAGTAGSLPHGGPCERQPSRRGLELFDVVRLYVVHVGAFGVDVGGVLAPGELVELVDRELTGFFGGDCVYDDLVAEHLADGDHIAWHQRFSGGRIMTWPSNR